MSSQFRFIGAGNIVRAILSGVSIGGKYENGEIGIFDISDKVRAEFADKGYEVFETSNELVKGAKVVVMSVIPQVIDGVVEGIKEDFSDESVILSVAAGIDFAWYEKRLGEGVKVIRCMPTLTAQSAMGSFAVCANKNVADEEFAVVNDFLSTAGIVEKIPEELMCAVVAFNGSAPGYFYHMTNVAVECAVKMGFEDETALRLFAQTMKGSAETLLNSGLSRQELEKRLRLPGGTTVAALEKMEELGFDECIEEGLKACVKKCQELG